MKTGRLNLLHTIFALFIIFATVTVWSFIQNHPEKTFSSNHKPILKKGQKWKIAYIQGGEWNDYQHCLHTQVTGLMKLGWLYKRKLPAYNTARQLWNWLADNPHQNDFILFDKESFCCFEWSDKNKKSLITVFLQNLKKCSIDLVLCMGTMAGIEISKTVKKIPVLVSASINPLAAGIVKSANYSKVQNLCAIFDPDYYYRQIRIFHNIFPFKKLGVLYEYSSHGILTSNMAEITKASNKLNFEVAGCHAPYKNLDNSTVLYNTKQCMQRLSSQADAIWLNSHLGLTTQNLSQSLQPLSNKKIPTWSILGEQAVREGALLSMGDPFKHQKTSVFYASTIAKILHGKKPEEISQIFTPPYSLSINKRVAKKNKIFIPPGLYSITDFIIESSNDKKIDNHKAIALNPEIDS